MPIYRVKYAGASDQIAWDGYVRNHANASLFHLFGWGTVIGGTYGHPAYRLMLLARDAPADAASSRGETDRDPGERIAGVLPLVHLKNAIFGNSLVSLPFLDGGGILANGREAEEFLLDEAIRLGQETGVQTVELRQEQLLESCEDAATRALRRTGSHEPRCIATRSDKVRMILALPESSTLLVNSFKSKLRSQINRASKAGLVSRIGGQELLEDFYKVFLINMRDLGSPVHSVKLMQHCLSTFSEASRIIVVCGPMGPVAAALVIGFGNVLRNPWASSLRKYSALSPNMFLYLRMLEYACEYGYKVFDFGRSTPGEGTYKFKEQWGSVPAPLFWHYIGIDGKMPDPAGARKTTLEIASRCWRKLPVAVTRILGPSIRKHISL
jgi:FemAB-related protein (PEP-CTERM system-associated)